MRIFVLGDADRPGVRSAAEQLLPLLGEHAEIIAFDLGQDTELSTKTADMALVLGGDGAILRAARQMGYHQLPVLGINLGKLGFLADLRPDEVRACFPRVAAGHFRVTSHLMFECVVQKATFTKTFLGLNEIAFHAGSPFHQIDLDLAVNQEIVSRLSGDGLILSTPIGSTAHNLSAGGPILGQELPAFVITPICPHTLTNRPVVDSADNTYTITLSQGGQGTSVVIDGQEIVPLVGGDRVIFRRAPVSFQLVKVPGRSYYQTLRDKLRWGTPPNYRQEG
jgi:NAD+ kinase